MISAEDLTKIVEGDVDMSDTTRDIYSRDASIFEIKPEVVVRPKNANDLSKLIQYVKAHAGVSLTARSAGTDMGGGPLSESIVLDFTKYFNNIHEIKDGHAVVEPGVYYRDFDKATIEQVGQIMPSYPASRELCTVGGIVSNNSGGEKTLTYGKTNRYVKRLKVVLQDGNEVEFRPLNVAELEEKKKLSTFEGELYRKMHDLIIGNKNIIANAKPKVSKNSCGYYLWDIQKEDGIFDLTQLIVGSQGTLGLVTEIEFALVKPKPHSRMLVIFLKDLNMLGEIANHVLKFKPESFESYDDHTFKVAMKFLPTLMKQMGSNIISLGISFIPEMFAVLRGGVPKMVLMAEFTADTEIEAADAARRARESLEEFHIETELTKTEEDAKKYWTIRRESFNMLRKHVKNVRTAPFIDDFVVLPEKLPEFLPKLYSVLDEYKHLTYTIAGHVGDGNFHIIPLMDLKEESAHKTIEGLSVRVYKLVLEYGGSITGEHNDGIIRTPFVKMQFGDDMYRLFEETKKIWDPQNIFNPGKKVGGSLEYAFRHVIKH